MGRLVPLMLRYSRPLSSANGVVGHYPGDTQNGESILLDGPEGSKAWGMNIEQPSSQKYVWWGGRIIGHCGIRHCAGGSIPPPAGTNRRGGRKNVNPELPHRRRTCTRPPRPCPGPPAPPSGSAPGSGGAGGRIYTSEDGKIKSRNHPKTGSKSKGRNGVSRAVL